MSVYRNINFGYLKFKIREHAICYFQQGGISGTTLLSIAPGTKPSKDANISCCLVGVQEAHALCLLLLHSQTAFFTFFLLFVTFPSSQPPGWKTPESFLTSHLFVLPTSNQSPCPVKSNSSSPLTSAPSVSSHWHSLISGFLLLLFQARLLLHEVKKPN